MSIVLIAMMLGIIPAMIASKKGRNAFGWWLYGSALFVIALPHAILARNLTRHPCPYCAESIKNEATTCPHCRREFPTRPPEAAAPAETAPSFLPISVEFSILPTGRTKWRGSKAGSAT